MGQTVAWVHDCGSWPCDYDWLKRWVNIGEVSAAVSLRNLAGRWSGPPDLDEFILLNNFSTPSWPKEILGISGNFLGRSGTFSRSSLVNTEENWLTCAFALVLSVAAGISLGVLRVGMPALSFLSDLMYCQKGLGFSERSSLIMLLMYSL